MCSVDCTGLLRSQGLQAYWIFWDCFRCRVFSGLQDCLQPLGGLLVIAGLPWIARVCWIGGLHGFVGQGRQLGRCFMFAGGICGV